VQLLRPTEVPLSDRDRVFCYSRARALLGLFVLLAAATALVLFSWSKQNWLGYYAAGVILLCLLIYQKSITARFQASNWLVRMTDDGLFIKFRSYLNCHFAAQDYTVVFLPFAELRSAKQVAEVLHVPDRHDNHRMTRTARKRRSLDLELAGDPRQLAIALNAEKQNVLAKTRIGAAKPSTRYHHFPVVLAAPDRLRIEWGVVPSAQTLLDALTRHTLVRPAQQSARDFGALEKLSRAEQEAHLRELIESGEMIGAIATARRLYGYDLAAAKDFVEELVAKQADKKSTV
jgi:hypothetical protein